MLLTKTNKNLKFKKKKKTKLTWDSTRKELNSLRFHYLPSLRKVYSYILQGFPTME